METVSNVHVSMCSQIHFSVTRAPGDFERALIIHLSYTDLQEALENGVVLLIKVKKKKLSDTVKALSSLTYIHRALQSDGARQHLYFGSRECTTLSIHHCLRCVLCLILVWTLWAVWFELQISNPDDSWNQSLWSPQERDAVVFSCCKRIWREVENLFLHRIVSLLVSQIRHWRHL